MMVQFLRSRANPNKISGDKLYPHTVRKTPKNRTVLSILHLGVRVTGGLAFCYAPLAVLCWILGFHSVWLSLSLMGLS